MRTLICTLFTAAGLALAAIPDAQAFEPVLLLPTVDLDAIATADAVPATDAIAPASDFGADALAGDALDDLRGGSDNKTTITNVSDVNGKVDGNTAINTVSGGNLVDGGAFGNAAGLSTVIQNSGNNVLIQNSTVVSVQFTPTP